MCSFVVLHRWILATQKRQKGNVYCPSLIDTNTNKITKKKPKKFLLGFFFFWGCGWSWLQGRYCWFVPTAFFLTLRQRTAASSSRAIWMMLVIASAARGESRSENTNVARKSLTHLTWAEVTSRRQEAFWRSWSGILSGIRQWRIWLTVSLLTFLERWNGRKYFLHQAKDYWTKICNN